MSADSRLKNFLSSLNNDKITMDDMRLVRDMMRREEILDKHIFPTKPSSDGYYHIQIKDETKRSGRRQIKAKTLEDLQEKVIKADWGLYGGGCEATFEDIFTIVESKKLEHVVDPEKRLSRENTVHRDKCEFKRYFGGTKFADALITDITKKDIEKIIWDNLQSRPMREKAFRSMCGILNQVFAYAYNEHLIQDNPYSRIDHKAFRDGIMPDSKPVEKVYHKEEQKKLMDAMHQDQRNRPWYMPAWAAEFQALIGGRGAEITPMEWSDIRDGKIMIYKQQLINEESRACMVVKHTKNHRDRVFPITREIQEFLNRLKAVHDEYYSDSVYLFPGESESGRLSYTVVGSYFAKLVRKNGISSRDGAKRGLHSFRRDGITKVINSVGGSPAIAAEIYGNSPGVAFKNYYTGVNIDEVRTILESS